jgi:hypothetical protein
MKVIFGFPAFGEDDNEMTPVRIVDMTLVPIQPELNDFDNRTDIAHLVLTLDPECEIAKRREIIYCEHQVFPALMNALEKKGLKTRKIRDVRHRRVKYIDTISWADYPNQRPGYITFKVDAKFVQQWDSVNSGELVDQ